VRIKFLYQFIF